MSGQVIPLRPFGEGDDVEGKLIGAVLELEEERAEIIESSGLSRDDFSNPRHAIAWLIISRLAARRLPVSALTVCSAGKRVKYLSDADLRWLNDLQEANLCTKAQALQIAEDIRVQARSRHVRTALQAEVEAIDRGRFNPARTSGALETIVHGLATDFSADETAEGELLALNSSWDANAEAGKANLDPTCIRLLDGLIGGVPENLTFIHGRPGIGKNVLATSMIRAQLERDRDSADPSRTGLFWLEDGTGALVRRWQAEDLNIPLREIGWKKLTPEQAEQKHRADDRIFALLKRVVHYRHESISRAELRRRAMRMIFRDKVRRIYVDNMKEIDHRDPRQKFEYWQGVGETTRVMRNLARDTGVPIIMLIHDTDETAKEGFESAPDPRKMSGGQAGGDRARLVLGVWKKGQSLRVTITKANEISEAGIKGPTIELQRNYEAGTINPEGGRLVDLRAEDAQDRREKKAQGREESVDERLAREAMYKTKKAATVEVKPPAPPPAQGSLLDLKVGAA